MTATISSYYDTKIVLIAGGITTAVCLSISLFAIQTKVSTVALPHSIVLTLVLLNCLFLFFIHLKLKLLKRFPASNDEKYFRLWKLDISWIVLFDKLKVQTISPETDLIPKYKVLADEGFIRISNLRCKLCEVWKFEKLFLSFYSIYHITLLLIRLV